jgi:hypothetical protein
MWEENVQVSILGINSVVVGMVVAGINVIGQHLLQGVYKGFQKANGFSIMILVIIKLFKVSTNCPISEFFLFRYQIFKSHLFCHYFSNFVIRFYNRAIK